jgi:chromosome partitioning protein
MFTKYTRGDMELVGLSEIAEMAGVSRQVVTNWRARTKDFPTPIVELASGSVWKREDIERWLLRKEGNMTKVISFINLKGGVGKTTSAVAISEFLAEEHQKRVLLVDLDPQTNATIALIPEEAWENQDESGQTLRQLFDDKLKRTEVFDINRAIITGVSNLHGGIASLSLLPSSLGLIDIQDQLALIPGGTFYSVSPVNILRSALQPVLGNYDYVIIDCPPNLGIITLNGISISTGYVIPTIPDILSTYGIPQIINRIDAFAETSGSTVLPKGIIVSKYRAQSSLHNATLEKLRRDADAGKLPPIFDTVVSEANKIAESVDVDASVNTLRQKYGYGNNFALYSSLAREFIEKC